MKLLKRKLRAVREETVPEPRQSRRGQCGDLYCGLQPVPPRTRQALRLTFPCPWVFVVKHCPNHTAGFVLPVAGIIYPAPATSSPLRARGGQTEGGKEGGGRHLLRASAGGECAAAGPLRGLQGRRAAAPPPRGRVRERGRRRKARGRKRTGGRGVEAAPAAGRVPGPRCCVTAREEQEEECGCGEFPCVAAEEQHRSRRRGYEKGAAAAAGCRAM